MHQHVTPWRESFSGHRVLVVDKVDNTRSSIASFVTHLRETFQASGAQDALIGVFVLHNKRRPKAADLPAEVLDQGRYFIGEETDNVQIAYPFNLHDSQPTVHGEHPSGATPLQRRHSLEKPPSRTPSPAPTMFHGATAIRSISSHYVETLLEKAVEEQQLVEKFAPTLLVAASPGALAPARFLRQYLRYRHSSHTSSTTDATPVAQSLGQEEAGNSPVTCSIGPGQHDVAVLTPDLKLYDEDTNPYLTHIKTATSWGPGSLAGERVLVVDKADSTRTQLASFITQLKEQVAAARQEVEGQGGSWAGDPQFGVFVLHNKQISKQADLPDDILNGRYFFGETSDNVQIAYPFST
ncbi:hypothetical protein V8C86DRAFT_2465498 [Haematococcus lacustris]